MKDGERCLREAAETISCGGVASDGESAALCRVAARHVLALLSPPCGERAETEREKAERHREREYLSWVAEREADKFERVSRASPVEAYAHALSTRRLLETFLSVVPLGKLEGLLTGVTLPDYAAVLLRNRKRRRSAQKPFFGFDPVTAQIYVRNKDTEEALRVFSALTGRPESEVAKEAVGLGARAMAGAIGAHMPSEMVAGEAEENAKLKEEAADRIWKATLTLRENGWTA